MMESQMMKWRKMEEEATGQRTQVTPGAEKLGKQLLPPENPREASPTNILSSETDFGLLTFRTVREHIYIV